MLYEVSREWLETGFQKPEIMIPKQKGDEY
jgi:hypothetical protein